MLEEFHAMHEEFHATRKAYDESAERKELIRCLKIFQSKNKIWQSQWSNGHISIKRCIRWRSSIKDTSDADLVVGDLSDAFLVIYDKLD